LAHAVRPQSSRRLDLRLTWVNRPWNNYINWTIIVVLFALSLLLAAQVILPNFFQ
jgi:Mn2+/Fe2+ NRAMP family transporter